MILRGTRPTHGVLNVDLTENMRNNFDFPTFWDSIDFLKMTKLFRLYMYSASGG